MEIVVGLGVLLAGAIAAAWGLVRARRRQIDLERLRSQEEEQLQARVSERIRSLYPRRRLQAERRRQRARYPAGLFTPAYDDLPGVELPPVKRARSSDVGPSPEPAAAEPVDAREPVRTRLRRPPASSLWERRRRLLSDTSAVLIVLAVFLAMSGQAPGVGPLPSGAEETQTPSPGLAFPGGGFPVGTLDLLAPTEVPTVVPADTPLPTPRVTRATVPPWMLPATPTPTATPCTLTALKISPVSSTIRADEKQAYTAKDDCGNDVTLKTKFTISPSGTCDGAKCWSRKVGTYTVKGTLSGKTSKATLTVKPGPLDHIKISPANATIEAGASQDYTATGYDAYGNSRGAVTVTYSIAPNGDGSSCLGDSCTPMSPGTTYTVTAADSAGHSATATLTTFAATPSPTATPAPAPSQSGSGHRR